MKLSTSNGPAIRALGTDRSNSASRLACESVAKGNVLRSSVERGLALTAEAARWVEIDDLTNILMPSQNGLVTALSIMDGTVSALDGMELFRQGRDESSTAKKCGGIARIGLGLGGAIPGLTGIACEAALGAYTTIEGVQEGNKATALSGLTQAGVAAGSLLALNGIGGALGPALVIGCCGLRVAGLYQMRHDREDGPALPRYRQR